LIEHVSDKSQIEMHSWMTGGHPISIISGPTFTWAYDWLVDSWHERQSYMLPRWRGTGNSAFAWGKWIVGDTQSGSLMQMTGLAETDAGRPIIATIESQVAKTFPNELGRISAHFNFVTGVGNAQGANVSEIDPRVLIYWSDDGGVSWSDPVERALGQQGRGKAKISIARAGRASAKGRRWRLSVSAPVYCSLLGGAMDAIPRKA
jgi:hypothetical protein